MKLCEPLRVDSSKSCTNNPFERAIRECYDESLNIIELSESRHNIAMREAAVVTFSICISVIEQNNSSWNI